MMDGVFAILGTVLFLGLFAWGWRKDSRGALIFTPFLLFSINEVTRNWPAGLYAPFAGAAPDGYALAVMFAGYLAFLLGYLLLGGVASQHPGVPAAFRDRPLLPRDDGAVILATAVGAALLTAAGLFLYRGVPPVLFGIRALVGGVGGGDEVRAFIGSSREALTKGYLFGGEYRGQGMVRLLLQVGWPYVSGLCLLLYLERRTMPRLLATVIMLLLSYVFVAGDGTRGPFLWSVIFMFVLASLVRPVRHRVIGYAAVAIVGLAIAVSLMSRLQSVIGSDDFWMIALQKVASRILLGNGVNTVHIIELVRQHTWELRLGSVLRLDLLNALPGVSAGGVPIAHELYQVYNPGATTTIFWTPTYISLAYLDFGVLGVLGSYFLAGVVVMATQAVAFRLPKTLLGTPLIALLVLAAGRIPNYGFTGVITGMGLAIAFAAVLHGVAALVAVVRHPGALRPAPERALA